METLTITDIGAAGILIVLVLDKAHAIINARRDNGHGDRRQGTNGEVAIRGKLHEMHRVVMREGPDGVPLVYRHPEIVEGLKEIADNTAEAVTHLEAIRNGGA